MRTGYGFLFSLFDSRLSGFKGKRSEIRDRNNEKDTSFDLASFIAGCRDFREKERDSE